MVSSGSIPEVVRSNNASNKKRKNKMDSNVWTSAPVADVTVSVRGENFTTSHSTGTLLAQFIQNTAARADIGKFVVKLNGSTLTNAQITSGDYSGKTLVLESYNNAA